jgi:signal transduction histidine kinase
MTSGLRTAVLPLIALCVALVGVGALEYRWTDELARAEEERLRAAMEAGAARFAGDVGREIGRLHFAFRPGASSAPDDATRYDRHVMQWAEQATDPHLLRSVLLATEDGGAWQLRRLDGDRFVDAEWTAELAPVRARLESRDFPGPSSPGPRLMMDVPAIMVGTRPPRPPEPGGPHPESSVGSSAPSPVIILLLDATVLRNSVLPELAERHFAGLEADLAVVARDDPGRVIWTSRPGFPAPDQRADITMPLLGGPMLGDGRPGPWLSAGRAGAPPWLGPPPGRRPAWSAERGGVWQLVVAHREGSLAAAVAGTRRRNLGVGLGVLALLGGSAALLALSGHRARALARQQVEFVAAVSHELRTPLAALRSAGENLADGVVTDADRVRHYGTMIHRESDRLSALVEQTLELSGLLGGERSPHREPVDPADLVREVLAELRPKADVAVDVPEGLPAISGDPVGLRSALRNLIDNALKHGGGQWVGVRARMSSGTRGRRELGFVVEDRGPGVRGEELGRLFEPFYRGARAREQRVPGSGLGLSVVRRVAEAHGGRVSVAAGPGGCGAAFTLHVPVAPGGGLAG